jgi:ferredoxin-NADP reductase
VKEGAALGIFGDVANAMAWPLRASHFVELVNPLWSTHELHARVEGVQDETATARTLILRPGKGFRRHRAGQHLRVGVVIDGKKHTRSYSISSAPERDDGCLTITVKAQHDGRVSRELVRNVRVGDHVSIGQPEGEFTLPEATPVRPLFVTGGSGITPVMSMLRSLAMQGRLRDVVHVHYAANARDVIFGRELAELAERHAGYRLHVVLTREPGGAHFDGATIEQLCPDVHRRDPYACGPASLLDAVEGHFGERLRVERFRARTAAPPSGVSTGRIRFSRSKAEADSDGVTNLLLLAERAGLDPRHGCRMGICHECTAVLKSGCVRDTRTNELTNEPGALVQPCVCAAAGHAELEM